MMQSSSNHNKAAALKTDDSLCSFCQKAPAVVCVQRPLPHRPTKRYSQSLCLLHYYSTSAVRERNAVSFVNAKLFKEQLPNVQELFAEAFVQLQQTIQEETAKAYSTDDNDPLAVVQNWHRPQTARPRRPAKQPTVNLATEGGFLRHTSLPQRVLLKQQRQAEKQQQLEIRMQRASDLTQKRKPNRTNIWNQVAQNNNSSNSSNTHAPVIQESNPTCSSCHSPNVVQIGNMTSRNGDMAKGETWGSKDRGDDVLGRYQCQACGRVWNEAE